MRRISIFLATLLIAASSLAASVADRSPFAQGHWWDPGRSGTGFDIFNAGGQVAFVWYTYDAAGRPIWYNAQGDLASIGSQSMPLWQQHWRDGRWSGYTVVGSVRLDVRHPESIDVNWDVRGQRGTWTIQPYTASGVISEVDHGGHWFDPAQSGWGFTLTEQGDVLGSVLYTYDAAGEPTWLAGFHRGMAPRIELFATTGTCPSCAYQPVTARSVGSVTLDFHGETQLTVRGSLSLPMAAGVNIDGAHAAQLSRPASSRAADRQLARFDSDAALKAYIDAGMLNVPFSGAGGFSASPAAVAYSTTNLVEAGVDEADVVKTDGERLYTFAHVNGDRQPVIRVARVANEGSQLDVLGSVPLAGGSMMAMANAGLYLNGGKLVAVSTAQLYSMGGPSAAWSAPQAWTKGRTHVEVLDAAAPGLPATVWRAEIDGYLIASRRIGDRLYLVSRFVPYLEGFVYGAYLSIALDANRQMLATTALPTLLPQVRINGGDEQALLGTSEIYVPPQGSRTPIADMIVVTAIDLASPRVAQALAIVGSAEAAYASPTNLYVASARQQLRAATGAILPVEPNPYITDVHQIALGSQAMSIVASAALEGYLGGDAEKASFRLSEHQGRLRAVTSSGNMWGRTSQNRLTILEPSTVAPGLLKTVSYLPNAQRPETLGKPAELLYATRFVGDRLYAVTFKKIDPLYIVDLANVTDPRIAGALELPGFSDYLHPLPNGLLLGFGKDTRPAVNGGWGDGQFAWYQGLQLTLFDVRDGSTLREMQRVIMGKRGSDSALLHDHHAFSMLTQGDGVATLAIPARIHDGTMPEYGSGDSAYYPWRESGLMRFELRGTTAMDARLVAMPSLITHAAPGVNYNDPAVMNGRAVQFRNGTIYVGNGQFWRQDAMGAASGPY